MRRLLDRLIRPFGLRVIKEHHAELVYQHSYVGGYGQYRDTQIRHNKRKLKNIWADEATLAAIVDDLRAHGLGETGICHGARNGFEVTWLREHLGGEVIGTDISETMVETASVEAKKRGIGNVMFERMDANGDGLIDRKEIEAMRELFRRRPPPR